MSNTSTTNQPKDNAQEKEGCCGGHKGHTESKQTQKSSGHHHQEKAQTLNDDRSEHEKSGCCCGGHK